MKRWYEVKLIGESAVYGYVELTYEEFCGAVKALDVDCWKETWVWPDGQYPNTSVRPVVDAVKEEYMNDDLVMSELARCYAKYLTHDEIQELLDWSGDSEFVTVDDVLDLE